MSIATGYLVLSVPLSIACIVQPLAVRLRLLLTFGDTVSVTSNEIYHATYIVYIKINQCALLAKVFKLESDWSVRCLLHLTFGPI